MMLIRSLVIAVSIAQAMALAQHVSMSALASTAPSSRNNNMVDVFTAGDGGYYCYRIPSLLKLNDAGAVALFAEARKYSCDDHGYVDVVVKISLDSGATWGPMTLVWGESSTFGAKHTIGNPAPVLTKNGTVVLMFNRDNLRLLSLRGAFNGSAIEWQSPTPTDHTVEVFGAENAAKLTWVATGPPGGISDMRKSSGGEGENGERLLISANWNYGTGGKAMVLMSDDGGQSWRVDETQAVVEGNEGQVSMAPNGSVIGSWRTGDDSRLLSWSNDDGATWSLPALKAPHLGSACAGSIIMAGDEKKQLLFSHNYAYPGARANMTIFSSKDSGASWTFLYSVDGVETGPHVEGAYSTMVAWNATHAALVYERGDVLARTNSQRHHTLTWLFVPLAGQSLEEAETIVRREDMLSVPVSAAAPANENMETLYS